MELLQRNPQRRCTGVAWSALYFMERVEELSYRLGKAYQTRMEIGESSDYLFSCSGYPQAHATRPLPQPLYMSLGEAHGRIIVEPNLTAEPPFRTPMCGQCKNRFWSV